MQVVTVRPGMERRLRSGHCWLFANEIDGDVAALQPGGAVEVRDARGGFVGIGYTNPASLITVRILSRDPGADIDDTAFYVERLQRAMAYRSRVMPGRRSLRLVASEGDWLLDVYCNTGAWALSALCAGASEAVAVDISAPTCELVEAGAAANGVSQRLQVRCGDARQVMNALGQEGEQFGAVFIDPPAFARNRKKAGVALHAYRMANEQALRLVEPGGFLFTSSCSYHIHEPRFLDEVLHAARRAGRTLRMVRRGEQSPDHPVIPEIPETRYLKHYAFQAQ